MSGRFCMRRTCGWRTAITLEIIGETEDRLINSYLNKCFYDGIRQLICYKHSKLLFEKRFVCQSSFRSNTSTLIIRLKRERSKPIGGVLEAQVELSMLLRKIWMTHGCGYWPIWPVCSHLRLIIRKPLLSESEPQSLNQILNLDFRLSRTTPR